MYQSTTGGGEPCFGKKVVASVDRFGAAVYGGEFAMGARLFHLPRAEAGEGREGGV